MLWRIAAPVLAVAGTGAVEGRAVLGDALIPLGVGAPPGKGSRTSPGEDSAGAIRMARLLLALSSDVTAHNDEAMRAFSTGSSSFTLTPPGVDALPDKSVDALPDKSVDALPDKGVGAPPDKGVHAPPDKGVHAPPDKGVHAPPDKGSRTSPGKDSAGAIRVTRLLLALSSDVTASDDEAMRAFSTGSSSSAIPNVSSATGPPKEVACSARGVNGQGRVLHPSVAAVETGLNGLAPFSSSTRALAGLIAGSGSARGVIGQGRVLHPSVAAVETEPNGRAPFSSPTRPLAGLAADWTSLAKNEMQDFLSESSCPEKSHELQTPETLGGRTWAKWALPLSPFAGLARQSASLWVVVLCYEHHICPPPRCCCYPAGFG